MRISLPSGTPAELALTDGATRGLVVIPDIMGLRPLFDDHVAHLAAEQGWSVCAPEPFPGFEDTTVEWRLANAAAVPDGRRLDDLGAAADATGCQTVSVIGFCMGGMFALKAAGLGRFHRAAAFYGMIRTPEHWQGDGNVEPLDAVIAGGACPVLAIAGTLDHWTPEDDLGALEAAGGIVVRYEGADHGFVHDPDRPAHRSVDAADAWSRVLDFLAA